jgi:hypothetical protein
VQVDSFNLHAATRFEAHERPAVERFCRYALRGPLAQARLTQGPRDTLLYRLKTPKPDGTTHLVCSPRALLQRLRWLQPLPKHHWVRCHGVPASAHRWRSRVIPSPPLPAPPGTCAPKGRWIDWASLLKRVFLLDVLACACGSTRRVIAVVRDQRVAKKLLEHLGLPSEPLPLGDVPAEPQGELWPTGPPHDEDRQDPAPEEWEQRLAEHVRE